jgi:ubiquinone/menaquinone biosynthesis C-methylase UbiE
VPLVIDKSKVKPMGSMSALGFHIMSLMFKVRDAFRPRSEVLAESGIKSGYSVLDFGCGPGGYIIPLVELLGPSGKIYALDVQILAIEKVKRLAKRKGIVNIQTIHSDCATGLPDQSVDTILLYDVFHDLACPNDVLNELHRILKPNGILSFSDHHMQEKEILKGISDPGMFRLVTKSKKTYSFSKADPQTKDGFR